MSRVIAVFLSLSLTPPFPAFALRPLQTGNNAGLEEEVAVALTKGQKLIAAGLEEAVGIERIPLDQNLTKEFEENGKKWVGLKILPAAVRIPVRAWSALAYGRLQLKVSNFPSLLIQRSGNSEDFEVVNMVGNSISLKPGEAMTAGKKIAGEDGKRKEVGVKIFLDKRKENIDLTRLGETDLFLHRYQLKLLQDGSRPSGPVDRNILAALQDGAEREIVKGRSSAGLEEDEKFLEVPQLGVRAQALREIGNRPPPQQDSFALGPVGRPEQDPLGVVAIVADGIGGSDKGDEASKIAVETVSNYVRQESFLKLLEQYRNLPENQRPVWRNEMENGLGHAVKEAHQKVVARSKEYSTQENREIRIGTTVVAVLMIGNEAFVASVGDSRLYHYGQGQLMLLTQNDSLAWRNVLNKRSNLSNLDIDREAEKRSPFERRVLTQYVGNLNKEPEVNLNGIILSPGDRLLLCSDGIWGSVPEGELTSSLAAAGSPAEKIAGELMSKAQRGRDNRTAVVIDFQGVPPSAAAAIPSPAAGMEEVARDIARLSNPNSVVHRDAAWALWSAAQNPQTPAGSLSEIVSALIGSLDPAHETDAVVRRDAAWALRSAAQNPQTPAGSLSEIVSALIGSLDPAHETDAVVRRNAAGVLIELAVYDPARLDQMGITFQALGFPEGVDKDALVRFGTGWRSIQGERDYPDLSLGARAALRRNLLLAVRQSSSREGLVGLGQRRMAHLNRLERLDQTLGLPSIGAEIHLSPEEGARAAPVALNLAAGVGPHRLVPVQPEGSDLLDHRLLPGTLSSFSTLLRQYLESTEVKRLGTVVGHYSVGADLKGDVAAIVLALFFGDPEHPWAPRKAVGSAIAGVPGQNSYRGESLHLQTGLKTDILQSNLDVRPSMVDGEILADDDLEAVALLSKGSTDPQMRAIFNQFLEKFGGWLQEVGGSELQGSVRAARDHIATHSGQGEGTSRDLDNASYLIFEKLHGISPDDHWKITQELAAIEDRVSGAQGEGREPLRQLLASNGRARPRREALKGILDDTLGRIRLALLVDPTVVEAVGNYRRGLSRGESLEALDKLYETAARSIPLAIHAPGLTPEKRGRLMALLEALNPPENLVDVNKLRAALQKKNGEETPPAAGMEEIDAKVIEEVAHILRNLPPLTEPALTGKASILYYDAVLASLFFLKIPSSVLSPNVAVVDPDRYKTLRKIAESAGFSDEEIQRWESRYLVRYDPNSSDPEMPKNLLEGRFQAVNKITNRITIDPALIQIQHIPTLMGAVNEFGAKLKEVLNSFGLSVLGDTLDQSAIEALYQAIQA
ncbi:MAG: serine/threonine-protein phosphatase [Candidatus Omnitrophica bacterium]|nr:serine/threonine-protein phosphatase [Candidatus Omnitrophota bacterium]